MKHEKKKKLQHCLECNRKPRIGDFLCVECYCNFAIAHGCFGAEAINLYKKMKKLK